mmetsp:Transcript_88920/g.254211  ORF Transcript_88920/g.254211 Transcript_88920/m.254211 type:complete len:204 (-) Transcript_88920:137-748(-)
MVRVAPGLVQRLPTFGAQHPPPLQQALGGRVEDPKQWVVRRRARVHLPHMARVAERGEQLVPRLLLLLRAVAHDCVPRGRVVVGDGAVSVAGEPVHKRRLLRQNLVRRGALARLCAALARAHLGRRVAAAGLGAVEEAVAPEVLGEEQVWARDAAEWRHRVGDDAVVHGPLAAGHDVDRAVRTPVQAVVHVRESVGLKARIPP